VAQGGAHESEERPLGLKKRGVPPDKKEKPAKFAASRGEQILGHVLINVPTEGERLALLSNNPFETRIFAQNPKRRGRKIVIVSYQ